MSLIRPSRLRINNLIRNLVRETNLNINDLIRPIFVTHNNIKMKISSMPGQFHFPLQSPESSIGLKYYEIYGDRRRGTG